MLAYERIGSGPPLVLLHGVGHRRQAWYPVVDALAPQRELILVDLPGHGESDPFEPAGRPVVEALRDELVAFLDAQGLDRPHIAGNSLGGRIALEAGAIGLARSVTALSPAGFWRSAAAFGYTKALFRTVEALGRRLAPQAPRLAKSKTGRALMFGWITSHPANIEPDRALGDILAFNRAIPALDTLLRAATPFTGQVLAGVPVTIGWGSRDLVLPPYQAKVARSALPQASHVTLLGCGHVPMSDDPSRVAEVLLRGSKN
ncbi:MAG TPA: alpha/beta fold hydrolase [Pseudonocardiaceae bacterium]|jgi:pimeloyl-ACP methyl ester carboxylesterase|nr:alpha/beta fold hydrolase [Pseudonocardiaceae bacterium]